MNHAAKGFDESFGNFANGGGKYCAKSPRKRNCAFDFRYVLFSRWCSSSDVFDRFGTSESRILEQHTTYFSAHFPHLRGSKYGCIMFAPCVVASGPPRGVKHISWIHQSLKQCPYPPMCTRGAFWCYGAKCIYDAHKLNAYQLRCFIHCSYRSRALVRVRSAFSPISRQLQNRFRHL